MPAKLRAILLIIIGIVVGGTGTAIGLSTLDDNALFSREAPNALPQDSDSRQETASDEDGAGDDGDDDHESSRSSSDKDREKSNAEADEDDAEEGKLPFKELRKFVTILDKARQSYVEDVSDEQLLDNAMHGMIEELDPHSSYLEPEDYKKLKVSTSGKFGGLGVKVQKKPDHLKVISPIDDTPASEAGIQPGDRIVRIDDKPVKGMSMTKAVHKMRGEPGTEIKLTIQRPGRDKAINLELERDHIRVESVRSQMLGDEFGYLRISQFSDETNQSVEKALASLADEADDGLKGLVLDLRNNPGGVVDAAVDVADNFLDKDKRVVSMKGRADKTNREFKTKHGDKLDGAPIVVLVNQGSASASEILAGALQDNGRAVIMGGKTFGKGSVQTVLPFKDKSAIKFTTARYYTPSGRSIQARGIEPDIRLAQVKIMPRQNKGQRRSEADLAGVLKNTGPRSDSGHSKDNEDQSEDESSKSGGEDQGDKDKGQEDQDADKKPLEETDYAVYEALNLLTGMHTLDDDQDASEEDEQDSRDKDSEAE